jgi:uncharacterized membrane protein
MKLKKYTHRILFLLVLSVCLASCAKYLEVELPRDQIISELVFEDDKTVDAVATGMYTRLLVMAGLTNTMRASSQSADEVVARSSNVNTMPLENNALTADNIAVSGPWTNFYQVIYTANSILEGMETTTAVSAPKKQQLRGEAYFSRAFAHFLLVNFWNDVPYVTTTDVNVTSKVSRQPSAEVYQHILDDLAQAQALLSASYPTANRARPNQAVATALLAEVHLYMKNWAAAETAATQLITNVSYKLAADVNNVFLRSSEETIWQLATVNGFTGDGATYVATTGAPNFLYGKGLMDAFEDVDQRKTKWVRTVVVSGVTYQSPYKYKARALVTTTPVPPAEDMVIFRLAEQYLIRAEARARQDNLPGAIADLKVIRDRASLLLPPIDPAISKPDLLLAIEKERRLELMAEMYHRWFDLKRTDRANAVLGALKPTWKATAVWFPIPAIELQRNRNLTQNEDYK